MAIIGGVDLGGKHPNRVSTAGQVIGNAMVVGARSAVWASGADLEEMRLSIWARSPVPLGGSNAFTSAANRYAAFMVKEMSRSLVPVPIQWAATAEAGKLNTTTPDDGWYLLKAVAIDLSTDSADRSIKVDLEVTFVAPMWPGLHSYRLNGASRPTNYSGAGSQLVAAPVGSTMLGASGFTRTGAEGAIPCALGASLVSPFPFEPSSTVSNLNLGGVKVFDTMSVGGNAVPATGFANSAWVEVKGPAHVFVGDLILTNGLILLRFQADLASNIGKLYVWSTGLATPAWQQTDTLVAYDSAGVNTHTLRSFAIDSLNPELGRVRLIAGTGSQAIALFVSLERGHYDAPIELTESTQANSGLVSLALQNLIGSGRFMYDSGAVADGRLGAEQAASHVATDYGYGAAFNPSASYPFISGFLYQNRPGTSDIYDNGILTCLGDTSGPAKGATSIYAIFAIPYGVSGSYSTATLQAEMESAGLSGGFVSAADAAASAGNTAKCPSGTGAGATTQTGALTVQAGAYDFWVRVRVTSTASALSQMRFGIWDNTAGSASAFQDTAPNQFSTGYVWVRVAHNWSPPAGHQISYFAQSQATVATDWFVDEVALVPLSLTVDSRGPQDLWQQFLLPSRQKMLRAA